MVGRTLVVGHDEDRAGVAELPEVRVFVHFFPGETGVAAEEGVALVICFEVLADVSDGHEETGNGRCAEGGTDIVALGVPMDVQRAFLADRTAVSGMISYELVPNVPLCHIRMGCLESPAQAEE